MEILFALLMGGLTVYVAYLRNFKYAKKRSIDFSQSIAQLEKISKELEVLSANIVFDTVNSSLDELLSKDTSGAENIIEKFKSIALQQHQNLYIPKGLLEYEISPSINVYQRLSNSSRGKGTAGYPEKYFDGYDCLSVA